MAKRPSPPVIEGTDLTRFDELDTETDAWLRRLIRAADAQALTLPLSRGCIEDEPIASFDSKSGRWIAGRFVGELKFEDRVLKIVPRFGQATLLRWLSRIWGVRVLSSKGKNAKSRHWLWTVLAMIWGQRFLAGARHGLPSRRIDEIYTGLSARGRIRIVPTSFQLARGTRKIVSRTRNRKLDAAISQVLVTAYQQLTRQLSHGGGFDAQSVFKPRTIELMKVLNAEIPASHIGLHAIEQSRIRYTPITEAFRPCVDLSLSIIHQRPQQSSTDGSRSVMGTLVDMAEVWELYLYHVLKSGLTGYSVLHTGRRSEPAAHLLKGQVNSLRLGALKPDILIKAADKGRDLGVVDAKYKTTAPSLERPHGILHDDLYQITAYMSALGENQTALFGALAYPVGDSTSNLEKLRGEEGFKIQNLGSGLVDFLGLDCRESEHETSERAFVDSIRLRLLSDFTH